MAGWIIKIIRIRVKEDKMMKILIVDDENSKAQKVKEVIIGDKIKVSDIDIVPSINDAIFKMRTEKYDLMIADMCLPEKYGSKLIDNGGSELIRILSSDTRINAPLEIIVLTAHKELKEKYGTEINKKSFDIIVYNDSSVEWKTKICDKINYLTRYLESPKEKRVYDYDIAILTAVERENEAVMNLSDDWTQVTKIENDSTIYYETTWSGENRSIRVVTTSLTQMGMVAAATISMKLIYNFTPRYIVMPGIAGGLKEEYEFGDIIIPKEVKDYCSGKYTTPQNAMQVKEARDNPIKFFVPTASSITTDLDIINTLSSSLSEELTRIHNRWPNNEEYRVPKIRTGYMASGDSVVQNSAVIEMMIKNHLRSADGLDMEAYGMYYAAHQAIAPKPTPICMKAISDFANKEKSDKHQSYSAYTSANFMKYFFINYLMK